MVKTKKKGKDDFDFLDQALKNQPKSKADKDKELKKKADEDIEVMKSLLIYQLKWMF